MNPWVTLIGTPVFYSSNAAGTVTLASTSEAILFVQALATGAATVTILGLAPITLPVNNVWTFSVIHTLLRGSSQSSSIVFAGLISQYSVHTVKIGNS